MPPPNACLLACLPASTHPHPRPQPRAHAAGGIAAIATAIGSAAIKAVVTMVGITVAGRTLLRPLYKRVAGARRRGCVSCLGLELHEPPGVAWGRACTRCSGPWPALCWLQWSARTGPSTTQVPRAPLHPNPPAETNDSTIFNALTLLIVLGTSLITQLAGLSLALGAFMAGLLLAETEYHLQVGAGARRGARAGGWTRQRTLFAACPNTCTCA